MSNDFSFVEKFGKQEVSKAFFRHFRLLSDYFHKILTKNIRSIESGDLLIPFFPNRESHLRFGINFILNTYLTHYFNWWIETYTSTAVFEYFRLSR